MLWILAGLSGICTGALAAGATLPLGDGKQPLSAEPKKAEKEQQAAPRKQS